MFSRLWLLAAALLAAPATCQYPAEVVYPPNGLNIYASGSPFACTSAAFDSAAYYCSWLQNDGNFVTYYFASDESREVIFTSETAGYNCPDGNNVCNLVYQGDSNLVLYIGGRAVWASATVSGTAYNLVFSGGTRPLDITGSWPAYPHTYSSKTFGSYSSVKPPGIKTPPPGGPGHCPEKRGVKGRRIVVCP
ncbi:hypothetical protein F5X97DRAFT_320530 [Nemania serpens]|nr:hypothetical protein F5X97DRAFT_320530 [Nemania serpens]